MRVESNYGGCFSRSHPLPSFFVIGPPRTATTWLYEVLQEFTVLPNPTKETRFFDLHFHRGLDWYLAHFPHAGGEARWGEVAPTYFASALARERIARVIPDAKVVCIFRNPVERVISLYRVKRAYGMLPWTFEQAILNDPELLESGKYVNHLIAWQRTFGPAAVLPTIYDDLRDKPQTYLNVLADFIGSPRFLLTPTQLNRVYSSENMTHPRHYYCTHGATAVADWCKARRLDHLVSIVKKSPFIKLVLGGGQAFAELSSDFSGMLYEHFRPDVEELESILKRDFPDWKAPRSQTQAA